MNDRRYSPWWGLTIPLMLLAFWEYEGLVGALPRYLPPPSVIIRELTAMLASGELFGHIGASLFRALSGFAIGATCGWLAGLLAGALRPVERFYEPIMSLTYPVPKIAALPIVFAWFGLGNLSKIVIITVSVFYPLYIATVAGAKATPRAYIWAARNMGAPRLTIILRVLSAVGAAADLQRAADRAGAFLRRDVRRRDGVVIRGARLPDRVRRSERAVRHRLCRHHHASG